jgi:PmbA protein
MERILDLASKKAEHAEVFFLKKTNLSVGFQADELKRIDRNESSGFALRVIADGRLGFSVSSDLDKAEEIVDKTLALARLGEEADYAFPTSAEALPDLRLDAGDGGDVPVETLIEQGRAVVERIKEYDPAVRVGTGAGVGREHVRILNTAGFDGRFTRTSFGAMAAAELVEEGNIFHVWETESALRPLASFLPVADLCVEKVRAGRTNVPLDGGKYRVILSPGAMADIVTAFTWYGANGRLASKGMGPLVGRVGEKIVDERLSVVDDPHYAGGTLSCPFDDEGTATRRRPLIENGVFRSFLTDLRSAAKLGVPSSGNGFREKPLEKEKAYGAGVSPDVSNLVIEPGGMTLAEMRSVAGPVVEIHHVTGILLGDMTNGDFSGNLELAFRVEDGARAGRIKDAMIGGNFYELFSNNLVGLEDRVHHTGNFGGDTGSYYLPHVCLDDVFIATKG